MKESKSYDYTLPCSTSDKDIVLHITDTGEEVLLKCGKNGTCRSCQWQFMGMLMSEIPRKRLIELSRGFECEKGGPMQRSCHDGLAMLLTGKATIDEKGRYKPVKLPEKKT